MQSPKKILLVELFSNGDCLYATAVARQIKQDFPGSHLIWAIASFCQSIIAGNPFVDEVMVIDNVSKNDERAFRRLKKELERRKDAGEWDELFITHIMGDNEANYDGSIRPAIFRGYGRPVTVPVTPVLELSPDETGAAKDFALRHGLQQYRHIVLFEFAPQSGQSPITKDLAIAIAEGVTKDPGACIILSSASKIDHPSAQIIDGSALSLRQTAALTHYCSLLLGCSSGITWISTSSAAKQLPMVQLLNPATNWFNPVSRDFERYGLDSSTVIELSRFDAASVEACVTAAFSDFAVARAQYHETMPLHFKTTRNIVYNLLCFRSFRAIGRHIALNTKTYGHRLSFYKEVITGFIIFPFRLTGNLIRKSLPK
ncbi:MAG TPA: hypothetical protein VGM41_20030 [Chitinophagaceae bacterium]|jgi:hypothetical protein